MHCSSIGYIKHQQQEQQQHRLALCVGITGNECHLLFADDLSALTIRPRFANCRAGRWFRVLPSSHNSIKHSSSQFFLLDNENEWPFPTRFVDNSFSKYVQVQLPICFLPDLSLFGWPTLGTADRNKFYCPLFDGAGQVKCELDWRRIETAHRYEAFLSVEIDSVRHLPKWTLNSAEDIFGFSKAFAQIGSSNCASSVGVVLRIVPEYDRTIGTNHFCSVIIRRHADGRMAFGRIWQQNLSVGDAVDFLSVETSCASAPLLLALDIAKTVGARLLDDFEQTGGIEHVRDNLFVLRVPLTSKLVASVRPRQAVGTIQLANFGTLFDPDNVIGQCLGAVGEDELRYKMVYWAVEGIHNHVRMEAKVCFMPDKGTTPSWALVGVPKVERTTETMTTAAAVAATTNDNDVEQQHEQQHGQHQHHVNAAEANELLEDDDDRAATSSSVQKLPSPSAPTATTTSLVKPSTKSDPFGSHRPISSTIKSLLAKFEPSAAKPTDPLFASAKQSGLGTKASSKPDAPFAGGAAAVPFSSSATSPTIGGATTTGTDSSATAVGVEQQPLQRVRADDGDGRLGDEEVDEVAEEVRLDLEQDALVVFTDICGWDLHMRFFLDKEGKFTSRKCCNRLDLPSNYANAPPEPGSWAHILYTEDSPLSVRHIVIRQIRPLCPDSTPPSALGATLRFAMQTVCPDNTRVWDAFLTLPVRACSVQQLLEKVEGSRETVAIGRGGDAGSHSGIGAEQQQQAQQQQRGDEQVEQVVQQQQLQQTQQKTPVVVVDSRVSPVQRKPSRTVFNESNEIVENEQHQQQEPYPWQRRHNAANSSSSCSDVRDSVSLSAGDNEADDDFGDDDGDYPAENAGATDEQQQPPAAANDDDAKEDDGWGKMSPTQWENVDYDRPYIPPFCRRPTRRSRNGKEDGTGKLNANECNSRDKSSNSNNNWRTAMAPPVAASATAQECSYRAKMAALAWAAVLPPKCLTNGGGKARAADTVPARTVAVEWRQKWATETKSEASSTTTVTTSTTIRAIAATTTTTNVPRLTEKQKQAPVMMDNNRPCQQTPSAKLLHRSYVP
ncbi:hypothetical protein niasHT_036709 [Heterodera trifolii]|uniref:Uncharacterized protein n=1 Tax=Heterodera trifolii TaxID=157864 RepID=A0ABD2IX52_9BILA